MRDLLGKRKKLKKQREKTSDKRVDVIKIHTLNSP